MGSLARSNSDEISRPFGCGISAEPLGGVDPLPDDHLHVVQGCLVGTAVRCTARQCRDFGDERFIFPAPIDDDLMLDQVYLPKRTSG